MGFPLIRMTCQRCQRVEPGLIRSAPSFYVLDDHTELELRHCKGWCFDCDHIRNIEDLSSTTSASVIRQMGQVLRSAAPRRKWMSTVWDCRSYHRLDHASTATREFGSKDWHAVGDVLAAEAAWLDFLSTRSVPARCLHCAGHNIEPLVAIDENGQREWLHPGCGGRFRSTITGGLNLCPPDKKYLYRPDGLFSHEAPYQRQPFYVPTLGE